MRLVDKVAFGSQDIGEAICRCFAAESTKVAFVAGSERGKAQTVIDAIAEAGGFARAFVCNAVTPHMIARGSGKIVNISSTAGVIGRRDYVAYGTGNDSRRRPARCQRQFAGSRALIADAALFLASDAVQSMYGSVMIMDQDVTAGY